MSRFMKIRTVVAESFHAEKHKNNGRTYNHYEVTSRFSLLSERA